MRVDHHIELLFSNASEHLPEGTVFPLLFVPSEAFFQERVFVINPLIPLSEQQKKLILRMLGMPFFQQGRNQHRIANEGRLYEEHLSQLDRHVVLA